MDEKHSFLKETYMKKGYLFDEKMILNEILKIDSLLDDSVEIYFEKDGKTIRSIYGFQNNIYFKTWLINQVKLRDIVKDILGEEVYLHQNKINIKNNSSDSIWPFHRDFPFWNCFDNIINNHMLNIVVFLDDVNSGSGELQLIPRSHNEFLNREMENKEVAYSIEGSASSDLLFNFSDEEINYFSNKYGIESTLGPKGSILVFNPNIIHGSKKSNIDRSRKIMILTFNRCDNKPVKKSIRPEYLCSTNYEPIQWKI